jgi:DNA-binding transcriptional LysR family regulator
MDAAFRGGDDLRLFLAVARAGSLSGGARGLGVNHSTVFRRINAFEERLGVRVFERLPTGYVRTAAGEETREAALRIEEEVASLGRKVSGQDLRLSGTVRADALQAYGTHFAHDGWEHAIGNAPDRATG